jgi:hypothetical protein
MENLSSDKGVRVLERKILIFNDKVRELSVSEQQIGKDMDLF